MAVSLKRGWSFRLSIFVYIVLVLGLCPVLVSNLRIQDSESRQIRCLSDMWNFRADMSPNRRASFEKMWYKTSLSKTGPVIPMPVPSSYNDITQDKELRDFVGWVWYDREFYVDSNWKNDKIVHLRIESAHYNAIVWVNSHFAFNHSGGHLPFEGEVGHLLNYFTINRITIAVNNTLTPTTLPPGSIKYERNSKRYPRGYFVQNLQMDFFNYAGIHRHVWLYTTPQIYIHDIILKTSTTGSTGLVTYLVVPSEAGNTIYCDIQVLDKDEKTVVRATGISGTIMIPNANLWWPYTMNKTSPAYLYTFRVVLLADKIDVYRQPFGIRTVAATDNQLLINKKPFYCLGVGRHEDADVRGKGLDLPLIAKDFNLMKWLGVNCFRTSHYPYSEELMDQADQQGFAVIDESPGVGIEGNNMGSVSLAHHQEVMREMIHRDKNRPSVIIWSVANEPQSYRPEAEHYFGAVVNFTRQLDATRPVTFVMNADFTNDRAAKFVDILCINRYYGWYSDIGHTEVIPLQLAYDLDSIYNLHHRPIILAEYGADAIAGLHRDPSVSFSEEYQVDLLAANHKVFNKLRHKYLVGEMVWNFADFQTAQNVKRVAGNKKGILTRQRQPKLAAFLIRSRYMAINNGTLNEDMTSYSSPSGGWVLVWLIKPSWNSRLFCKEDIKNIFYDNSIRILHVMACLYMLDQLCICGLDSKCNQLKGLLEVSTGDTWTSEVILKTSNIFPIN